MKKTVRVPCLIHEGSLGRKTIKQLESMIKGIYQTHFGVDYKLVFMWMTLPKGQAYLAGKISTASTVMVAVEDGLPANKRHPFMLEICDKWQYITGCNKNEIILNSPDFSVADESLNITQSKFDESKKTWAQAKIMSRLLLGRISKGYFTTDINL
ncbi:hypothetical protein R50073_40120 [Maricurvus nonylphenolicus]|uniref:hypothetical protein n=1 Tax=Maricurvus nonylphenolicus TaxID=1008307 RepID=UPI0036F42830